MDIAIINTCLLSLCAVISATTPVMIALLNRSQSRRSLTVALNVEKVRTDLERKSSNLESSINEMNGERKAMLDRIHQMHDEIVKLAKGIK